MFDNIVDYHIHGIGCTVSWSSIRVDFSYYKRMKDIKGSSPHQIEQFIKQIYNPELDSLTFKTILNELINNGLIKYFNNDDQFIYYDSDHK